MQELTYYIACSVDGFIAHKDDSHDGFLFSGEHITDLAAAFPETFPAQFREALGIAGENQQFDVVLMGRKTYEVGLKVGVSNPYPHLQQYLFSRSMKNSPDPAIKLVSEDAVGCVQGLKQQAGKGIWLCGGAELAATLGAVSLIDRVILKVNPFLMGDGISLLSRVIQPTALELVSHKVYGNGVLLLDYRWRGRHL